VQRKNMPLYLKLFALVGVLFAPTFVFANTYSASFDGTNDQFNIASLSSNIDDGYTVEFWVKTNTDERYIFAKRTGEHCVGAAVWTGGVVNILSGSGSCGGTEGVTDISTNTWRHVAIVYNGASSRLYIDGVLDSSPTLAAITPSSISSALYIGSSQVPSGYYQGLIDNFRVWSVARTEEEINAAMCDELTTGTGLVASYLFENDALDATANNNDLTESGPTYVTDVPTCAPSGDDDDDTSTSTPDASASSTIAAIEAMHADILYGLATLVFISTLSTYLSFMRPIV
jgi:hypothetical protein